MKLDIRQKFAGIAAHKLAILFGLAIIFFGVAVFENSSRSPKMEEKLSDVISLSNQSLNYSSNCSDCHNGKISQSGVDRNRCSSCHEGGHGKPPARYYDVGRATIHRQHGGVGTTDPMCLSCHLPACNRCHDGHKNTSEFQVSKNCQTCHGGLPEPKGHPEQRLTFKKSMHGWMMYCNTCHDKDKLRFKDIATYDLNANESSLLCRTCHSKQYNDNNHPLGAAEDIKGKCVSCHNPHSRNVKERFENLLKVDVPVNETLSDIGDKVMGNAWLLIIALLLVGSIALEYLFKPEKGNIVLSKTLRIENEKSKTRAIKLGAYILSPELLYSITEVLKKNNIDLIGVSSVKGDTIVFLSGQFTKNKEEELIKEISLIEGISGAEYKDYEV